MAVLPWRRCVSVLKGTKTEHTMDYYFQQTVATFHPSVNFDRKWVEREWGGMMETEISD